MQKTGGMVLKRKTLLYLIFASILILFGCNGDDHQVTGDPENGTVEQDDHQNRDTSNDKNDQADDTSQETVEQNNMKSGQTLFPFSSFDLDVEYEGNREFDVDYEDHINEVDDDNDQDDDNEGIEAEIKDELNNEHLRGNEAFERLRPIFESFTFTKDTPKEEVISEVLKAFNLKDDYIEFDLDIDFSDGIERDYEDRNG